MPVASFVLHKMEPDMLRRGFDSGSNEPMWSLNSTLHLFINEILSTSFPVWKLNFPVEEDNFFCWSIFLLFWWLAITAFIYSTIVTFTHGKRKRARAVLDNLCHSTRNKSRSAAAKYLITRHLLQRGVEICWVRFQRLAKRQVYV